MSTILHWVKKMCRDKTLKMSTMSLDIQLKNNNGIKSKIKKHGDSLISVETNKKMSFSFQDFSIKSICLDDFNNYFRDSEHCLNILSKIFYKILPEVSKLNVNELRTNAQLKKVLRFHSIEQPHLEIVRNVLNKMK